MAVKALQIPLRLHAAILLHQHFVETSICWVDSAPLHKDGRAVIPGHADDPLIPSEKAQELLSVPVWLVKVIPTHAAGG